VAGLRLIAHDLERLGVPTAAEPGPVAGGRLDQVRLQVLAHRDLGAEGADRGELGWHVVVDRDESGRPEVDRGRRRLETEHRADLAGGDHDRPVGVAVVLVHVLP
jgi:hypothetical protein